MRNYVLMKNKERLRSHSEQLFAELFFTVRRGVSASVGCRRPRFGLD